MRYAILEINPAVGAPPSNTYPSKNMFLFRNRGIIFSGKLFVLASHAHRFSGRTISGAEEAEGAAAVGVGEGGEGAPEGEGAPPVPPIHATRHGNSLLFTFSLIKVWFDGACERHRHHRERGWFEKVDGLRKMLA